MAKHELKATNGDDILFGDLLGGAGDVEEFTIDFDTLDFGKLAGSTYTEDGFTLVSAGGSGGFFALTADDFSLTGSTSLFSTSGGSTITLEDDGSFNLESIDLAELLVNSDPYDVTFTGTKSDGSEVTQTFTIDGDATGAQTFDFSDDFTDLVSLSWVQGNPTHQFDNIVITVGTSGPVGSDDILDGGNGNDVLYGLGGDDMLIGGNGSDVLYGGTGNDKLDGGNGADSLFGGDGDDLHILDGGNGDDMLDGGDGNDTLVGGRGNDLFVFADGDGADTFNDFVAGAGTDDVIDLTGESAVSTFADVHSHATQVDADTVIDVGGGDSITLLGVNVGVLHADDFML